MRDASKEILTAIVGAIGTVLPSVPAYTVVPPDTTYPYVLIGDPTQRPAGNKQHDISDYEVLIQLCYKQLTSRVSLLDTKNILLEKLAPKAPAFTLSNNFTVTMQVLEINYSTDILTDTGMESVGIIKIVYSVIDDLTR